MKILKFILLIVLTIAASRDVRTQDLCDIAWDPPLRVSYDSAISGRPILCSGNSTLHLLWFGLDLTQTGSLASSGILYARSGDGGESMDPPVVLLPYPNTNFFRGCLAVDGQRVFVAASASIDTFVGIALFESTDGGLSWSGPRHVYREQTPGYIPLYLIAAGPVVFIGFQDNETNQYGIIRSGDGGATWDPPAYLGREFSDIDRVDGRLHAVGAYPGAGQTEVGYSFSPDTGRRWLGFTPLSPEDQVRSVSGRISVSPGGSLHAAWIDTGMVLARSSRNNGVSWAGWTMLSNEGGNVQVDVGSDNEFVFIVWDRDVSDARGLRARLSNDFGAAYCPVIIPAGSALAGEPVVLVVDSTVHLAWVEIGGESRDIYYRRGTLQRNPEISSRPPENFLLKQSYPNPANGTVFIDFDIPVETDVIIELYSAIGQRIATLEHRSYDAGRYSVAVDIGALPSGAYFYRLSSPRFVSTRKLMVLR